MKKMFEECQQGKAVENREPLLKILQDLCVPSNEVALNIPKVGQKRAGNGAATGYSTEDDSCDEQEGVVSLSAW